MNKCNDVPKVKLLMLFIYKEEITWNHHNILDLSFITCVFIYVAIMWLVLCNHVFLYAQLIKLSVKGRKTRLGNSIFEDIVSMVLYVMNMEIIPFSIQQNIEVFILCMTLLDTIKFNKINMLLWNVS